MIKVIKIVKVILSLVFTKTKSQQRRYSFNKIIFLYFSNTCIESDEDKNSEKSEKDEGEDSNDEKHKRYSFELNFAVILKKKSRKLHLKRRKRIVRVKTKTRRIPKERIKIRRKQKAKRKGKLNPYYV